MKKIIKQDELSHIVNKLHKENKSIVLAGGVFDILHPGHTKFLEQAKKQGDLLMILLESDTAVKKRKGVDRPFFTQENRAQTLSSIKFVDYIILLNGILNDEDYLSLTNLIKPAIIATTTGDPILDKKQKQAASVGGKVVEVTENLAPYSTSDIINRIKNT